MTFKPQMATVMVMDTAMAMAMVMDTVPMASMKVKSQLCLIAFLSVIANLNGCIE